jgi:tetratricopeptide (TPR) repeat protein
MIVRIAGEGQYLVDESAAEQLSERNAKLEAAIRLNDEVGFRLALAELLTWVRSVGRLMPVMPDVLEPSDVFLPSENATLDDERPVFAAVALYRKLAAADPDRYRPGLAASLNNLGARLFAAGRLDDAAVWVTEAVALYRELAAADPDRYRPGLASTLNNLGVLLSDLGLMAQALRVTQEAVVLYRELAAASPDRYRPGLAASLNNLGARLFAVDRPDEALPVTREAVALYRELAASRTATGYRLDPLARSGDAVRVEEVGALYTELAASLDNLAAQLSALGSPDAAPVMHEAADLHRALAIAFPPAAEGSGTSSRQAAGLGQDVPPPGSAAEPVGRRPPTPGRPRRGRRPRRDPATLSKEAALGAEQAAGSVQTLLPHQSAAYDDLVRKAFAELVQPGRLLFNPPDRMQLGDTERVEVRLTRTLTLDAELLKDLRGHGEPQLEEIPASPLMAVTLKGDGFRITPYGDEEQSVTPDEITTWEFDIRALKRGQQRLVISVSLRIPVPGQPLERKSIPVREAIIDVQVGAPAFIVYFVSANWQWFVGTVIALAAVLVAVLH